MVPSAIPGSRAISPAGFEQFKAEPRRNGSGMPARAIRAYNATGGTLTKGGVYALTTAGAALTTKNPQVGVITTNAGRSQQFVVAEAATPNNSWGFFIDWGYCEALVEGTVDVAADDALVPVVGQIYLVKGGAGGGVTVAEALEAQAANSSVLTDIYLRGDSSPVANGSVQYAEVSIAAAAILDLADTPVELVPAPGAGNILEFLGAVLMLDHAGTGFAESADNLQIAWENEAGAKASEVIEMTGFIDQTADTVTFAVPDGGAATPIAAATAIVNKALVLVNINDDVTDAGTTTSVLRVKTAYRVHATGF